MWFRTVMYRWMFPAVLVLPIWLLVGWSVFDASGWAFLWVLFIAIPSVAVAQLVLTLLVRSRPSVAEQRALSWRDVAGFGVWHVLTIIVGCYPERWFGVALAAAVLAALGVFWLAWTQLREELQGSGAFIRVRQTASGNSARGQSPQQPSDQSPGPAAPPIDPSRITIVRDAPDELKH